MLRPLRVIILGLGSIGRSVAREIARAPDLRLVGVVDPAPRLVGRDLGALLGVPSFTGIRIASQLASLGRPRAEVAVHLAASRFAEAIPVLHELVARKLAVVSTCEELIAAELRWPAKVRALDQACRQAGLAILPAGVNPGFVMDLLPAALANICVDVRSVRVVRHVDTARRRAALRRKTGAGLTPAEFRERARHGAIGHVGLRDSLLFLMNHLPLEAEVGEESLRPIVARRGAGRGRLRIAPGRVAGIHQSVRARDPCTGRGVGSFELRMAVGLPEPHDEIRIDGDPPLRLRFEGGVSGDRATVGAVLNTIRCAPEAPAGFGG